MKLEISNCGPNTDWGTKRLMEYLGVREIKQGGNEGNYVKKGIILEFVFCETHLK
jgi:hypothetical protein